MDEIGATPHLPIEERTRRVLVRLQAVLEVLAARAMSALGSARETLAALHVAQAWTYLQASDDVTLDEVVHLVATLVRLVRRAQ